MAWLRDRLESDRGRAAQEAPSAPPLASLVAGLTRFGKINRTVCVPARLLLSSLGQRSAADFACFYKL